MMKTIVIVGAGAGLGLSIARRFGREQFNVALIARRQASLDALAATLRAEGIEATGFAADITDEPALRAAFDAIRAKYGPIEVMEYSPAPSANSPFKAFKASSTTIAEVEEQFRFFTLGAIRCAHMVVEEMVNRRRGAMIFTGGGSGVNPVPMLTPIGIAMAAARSYAMSLSHELRPTGVYVGYVSIATYIQPKTEGDPDKIAETYWQMYRDRQRAEYVVGKSIGF
jgi:short-subunit dehydrogenase